MHFIVTADTDIGILKDTNQDSLLVKHGRFKGEEVLLAIACDGMGGLEKGELASATVIRAFSEWFDSEAHKELENPDMSAIGNKWSLMLKSLNEKIGEYGKSFRASLGTTFTGILLYKGQYVIVHVGDTRVYFIDKSLNQLTEDQTFVAREIKRGNMTPEQAKIDKRRNMLLQCVGASPSVEPQIITGSANPGVYMICSDGFRHELSEEEMYAEFNPSDLFSKDDMNERIHYLIEQNKKRNEKDNISVILIKAD